MRSPAFERWTGMPEALTVEDATPGRRWWARAAFAFALLTVVVPLLFAGLLSTMGILLIGVGGVVVCVAAVPRCAGQRLPWQCWRR